MGVGDNIMGTGMARGAHARGKRIAFGNEVARKIIWDVNSEIVFRGNPNIAPPNSEGAGDLEWIGFHRGNRIYNRDDGNGHWIWNYDFRPTPGEIFLDQEERKFGRYIGLGHVVIEPNVPRWKKVAPNKQWPVERYQWIVDRLIAAGKTVVQLRYPRMMHRLQRVRIVSTPNVRLAMSVLRTSALYIGPEGGMHHAAAAFAKPAVVLFGGFIPPQVTGYDMHINLTGGAEACGSYKPCDHCKAAMAAITCEEVEAAAQKLLKREAA